MGFNSKSGSIDSLLYLYSSTDLYSCFNSKSGSIDRVLLPISLSSLRCFNSKSGSIDSLAPQLHPYADNSFNSKSGSIDRISVTWNCRVCKNVSIPKVVRLIVGMFDGYGKHIAEFQFQKWFD